MTETKKKTAIVVGATGGIGRAVALRLANDGFCIAAAYGGNASKAEEIVTAAGQDGSHRAAWDARGHQ